MRSLLFLTILFLVIFSCTDDKARSGELTTKSAESLIKGNYELALKQADSALMFNDENSNAYNNRGVAKRKLKFPYKDTEADLLKSLSLEPENYVAMSSLMTLYFDSEEYAKVIRYAEEYQKLHEPDSSGLNNIIGESYRVNKNLDKALYFLEKAVQVKPTSWSANLNLGEVYIDKKDYSNALIYLDRAKRLNPENSATYNEIGISHYVLGRVDSALHYVNSALKLEQDTGYMINKALYLIKLDSIDSGCNWFAKVEKMGRTIESIYGADSEVFEMKIKHCK
jgi:tetratricopeptide (TPR) repeat protein